MEWCGEVNFVWINYRVKILVLSTSRVQLVKFVAVKAVFVLLSFFLSFFFISLSSRRDVLDTSGILFALSTNTMSQV